MSRVNIVKILFNFDNLSGKFKSVKISSEFKIKFMTIRQYLWLMLICTVLCWGGFLTVLFFINPQTAGDQGFIMFYASLFFALLGTLALLSYFFRLIFNRIYTRQEKVQVSFRQAVFFSIVIVGSLFLQAHNLMTWLNSILLVLLVTFLEFLILSLKKDGDFISQQSTD